MKAETKVDQNHFWEHLAPGQISTVLMDMLPDTLFFVKDLNGKYIFVNKAFTKTLLSDKESIIGKTDHDLFGPELASQYQEDDNALLKNSTRIIEKTELVTYRPSVVRWYLTTKIPVFDTKGTVIGLAGITRPSLIHKEPERTGIMSSLSKAVTYIYDNKFKPLFIDEIAAYSGISISTLERSFKKHFNCSPGKFVTQVKVSTACELLGDPSYSINEVCYKMGYSDPVVFTRIFKREMKVPPSAYRKSIKNQ